MLAGWLAHAESSPIKEEITETAINPQLSQMAGKINLVSSSLFDFSNKTDNGVSARSVPLPAAILLFGPAMVCLMGLRTKRK
ncbi:hypothetical protein [Methylocucumis oryzae]|uniref:Uncharacterized protein n=1 Tax=Methylocucumis oryzae TaxID=1632867 RepID=A0A0F3IGE5_9GAMM|nr:hypothetical protein [Methylocucumis oryzae]KJV05826.1 hypothetical protein VZ94_15320 [Methylocucumis oryzae]